MNTPKSAAARTASSLSAAPSAVEAPLAAERRLELADALE